jgi:hypothetical protein
MGEWVYLDNMRRTALQYNLGNLYNTFWDTTSAFHYCFANLKVLPVRWIIDNEISHRHKYTEKEFEIQKYSV